MPLCCDCVVIYVYVEMSLVYNRLYRKSRVAVSRAELHNPQIKTRFVYTWLVKFLFLLLWKDCKYYFNRPRGQTVGVITEPLRDNNTEFHAKQQLY
jgi:predicted alpha-1,6-mannanase (GH76 family)